MHTTRLHVFATGGKGAYAAIDPVAGPFSQQIGQSLRDRATYIIYSRLGGMTANIGIADLIYRGIVVRCYVLLCTAVLPSRLIVRASFR